MKTCFKKFCLGLFVLVLLAVWAIPASAEVLKILNPVGEPKTEMKPSAKRLDTLEGKRIGLYVARRANSFEVMERVAENLQKMYPTATIMGGKEGTLWAKKAYDRPGDIDILLKEKPDAIIMAMSS
jgi:hypothetical protein